MKRNIRLLAFLTIPCCLFLFGCGVNSRIPYINVGDSKAIVGNETMEVIDATISDGKIIVNLNLDFEELTLMDLMTIGVNKLEVDFQLVPCNIEETSALNDEDIFNTPYQGRISLVFTDESISCSHKLSSYYLRIDYDNGDGTMNTYQFTITDWAKEAEAD